MGVKELFEKHFPYADTKYVYDDNIVDEDNKTVRFEKYSDIKDIDERINNFKKDLEREGYKLDVLGNEPVDKLDHEEPFTDEEYDELYTGVIEGEDPDFFKKYREDFPKDFDKDGFPNLENASKDYVKNWIKGQKGRHQGWREWLDEDKDGKIEEDEMADFQKSLDDYASKNKKGRDDIPVTTRR